MAWFLELMRVAKSNCLNIIPTRKWYYYFYHYLARAKKGEGDAVEMDTDVVVPFS